MNASPTTKRQLPTRETDTDSRRSMVFTRLIHRYVGFSIAGVDNPFRDQIVFDFIAADIATFRHSIVQRIPEESQRSLGQFFVVFLLTHYHQ